MSLLTQALKQAAKRADDMEKGVMAIPSAPEAERESWDHGFR
jgi:hypothetical protein